MSSKKSLSVSLPEEQFQQIEAYCKETGYSKTEVAMAALKLFLAIKNEELEYLASNPNSHIKSRVVFDIKKETEPQLASVLMY